MDKGNQQEEFNTIESRRNVPHLDKLLKYQIIIELILLIVAILGFFVSNEILTVSLILLAIVYFFLCFTERKISSEVNTKASIIILYLSYWGKSMLVIGILFAITNWSGGPMNLIVGILVVFAASLALFYFSLKGIKDDIISNIEIIRNVIFILIGIYIYIEYFGTKLFV